MYEVWFFYILLLLFFDFTINVGHDLSFIIIIFNKVYEEIVVHWIILQNLWVLPLQVVCEYPQNIYNIFSIGISQVLAPISLPCVLIGTRTSIVRRFGRLALSTFNLTLRNTTEYLNHGPLDHLMWGTDKLVP